MSTDEGRVVRNPGTGLYTYEYNLKDHLGNVRVTFDDNAGAARLIQEDEFFAFGLSKTKFVSGDKNNYLYNGKELQTALAHVYDYGARFYDPVIGRWNVVDPLAESYQGLSPYNYADNNPVNNTDPDGTYVLYGAAAQALFGVLKQQPYNPPQKSEEEKAKEKQEAYNSWMESLRSLNRFMINVMEFKLFAENFVEIFPAKTPKLRLPVDTKLLLSQVSVEQKLGNYVLNLEHPVGGSKASWFQSALGFNRSNMSRLAEQIVFDLKTATKTSSTKHGTLYNQTIRIRGANGRVADITTGWIKGQDNVYKLVTAFPKK